jgi:hypothetical protein
MLDVAGRSRRLGMTQAQGRRDVEAVGHGEPRMAAVSG